KLVLPLFREDCRLPFLLKGVHGIEARGQEVPVAEIIKHLVKHEQPGAKARPAESPPAGPPRPAPPSNVIPVNDTLAWLAGKLREGKLALLVGPAASAAAGLPLRDRLLERLRKELRREDPDFDDLAALASWYLDKQQLESAGEGSARRALIRLIM